MSRRRIRRRASRILGLVGIALGAGGLFHFLAPGDPFDLAGRDAYRSSATLEPLERIEPRPWPKGDRRR